MMQQATSIGALSSAILLAILISGPYLDLVDAGHRLSRTLNNEDESMEDVNEALLPWKEFENSYTIMMSTEGSPQSPGQTREFIKATVQQIPAYTPDDGLTKEEIETRKGAAKLITLMDRIPEIGAGGKKECTLQELSMRLVFESIFSPNVHIQTFLQHYDSLYYNFCMNDIDRQLIKLVGQEQLKLSDKFDAMEKAHTQAAKDLPQANEAQRFARGLTLYLKSQNKATDISPGQKPLDHVRVISKLIDDEIVNPFQCKKLAKFTETLLKYKLITAYRNELSDDSRKWIDTIDICEKIRFAKEQLILIEFYEEEAARINSVIFMPSNPPNKLEMRDPELIEDDLLLIIRVLNAKKRLYREDQRFVVNKLQEVKFEIEDDATEEICNLITVKKLQELMVEYNQYPNLTNYLSHKAKSLTKLCKDKIHKDIAALVKHQPKLDVEKLKNLRLRIIDATEGEAKKGLYHHLPVESFVEGTMAFLLSQNYEQNDGFDIIANYLTPKTPEEMLRLREGAYLILGDLCDEIEDDFSDVHELFNEFTKLYSSVAAPTGSSLWNRLKETVYDTTDLDWMTNVNICNMIKFGNI